MPIGTGYPVSTLVVNNVKFENNFIGIKGGRSKYNIIRDCSFKYNASQVGNSNLTSKDVSIIN